MWSEVYAKLAEEVHMRVNAAIQKLNEDAVRNERAATAWFAGIQNGREFQQNEICAEKAARCCRKAEEERILAELLASGRLP